MSKLEVEARNKRMHWEEDMITMKVVTNFVQRECIARLVLDSFSRQEEVYIAMQNEMMEEKNVNNIVGVQLMARDNIYMVLVEYKYVKDVQEEVGCMMRSVGWTA